MRRILLLVCSVCLPTVLTWAQPRPQALQWLYFAEVKPRGWLLQQMQHDLQDGFVGHLDELVPDLIVKDDIYGKHRLTKEVKRKDVGAIGSGEWDVQYLWWNSETQSNWRDGMVRHALLTDNTAYLQKARTEVNRLLATQDKDGYLGVYAPDLRYRFTGENGELWAQTTLFRMLLGYYEATREPRVLKAIERAVAVTMRAYPLRKATPFKAEKPFAGLAHGLAFTDVLDRLYQLTGRAEYLEYAAWLYQDYCEHPPMEEDIAWQNLLNPMYAFKGHGVHTYEHLRSLLTAYYAGQGKAAVALQAPLAAYEQKLQATLSPSGGPIGDEWIVKRTANASTTGYEYCSIHELLDSYSQLLQKTGDLQYADRMEWLLYNAGQGARHPQEPSIAYLKTDNSFSMTGPLTPSASDPQTRFKYSPAHQDAAVCCVPNAGRLYPYFVKAMWMRNNQGLLCTLYGPNVLETQVRNTKLKIEQATRYPFDFTSQFTITIQQPTALELAFRKPRWASGVKVVAKGAKVQQLADRVILTKTWRTGDKVQLRFTTTPKMQQDGQGDTYFSLGPLVMALPFTTEPKPGKAFPVPGFRDVYYPKATNTNWKITPATAASLRVQTAPVAAGGTPWSSTPTVTAMLQNEGSQQEEKVTLVPMGGTILRRVTFSK
ncbi:beta-L-arabinofuranosidase domain-containing protein [Hymenobacter sp. BT730]|uniref:beta-L-arabinofuranosidase domain-containing protein n=1 Tax=Hymenobacter sp. BT730 TaxID=3063332 RepID=UPI0026E0B1FB|nr:beta-L-arabinofuranosidase domain-containing protein [Hymenobacter sp. BT730]